ncbi:MAG: 16S rRNA (cytosine(1402)-N(4))-methyltransferase RsmH [Desulfonatronovibrio sp.]
MTTHYSVMSGQVIDFLQPCKAGRYFDGTIGLGGHSLEILNSCGGECFVLGTDLDQDAVELSRQRLKEFEDRAFIFQDTYRNFEYYMEELGWDKLDGVVLDLGVSSLQLEVAEKGFSFIKDGPLDMRMGPGTGSVSAERLLEKISYYELKKIIGQYGEEPMAGRIARAVIDAREKNGIHTTLELAEIVEKAYPARRRALARNHPATKTFQALRIAVNKELESLRDFLERVLDRLSPGARLVVISFHSLEDRIVKHFFKREATECVCPPGYPVCQCGHEKKLKILTKKPFIPTDDEIRENPRSRSAKLRSAERI